MLKEDERVCIRGKLSNCQMSFIFCHVLLPKFAKRTLYRPNSVIHFCVELSFATLSKPSSLVTECRALRFGEEL